MKPDGVNYFCSYRINSLRNIKGQRLWVANIYGLEIRVCGKNSIPLSEVRIYTMWIWGLSIDPPSSEEFYFNPLFDITQFLYPARITWIVSSGIDHQISNCPYQDKVLNINDIQHKTNTYQTVNKCKKSVLMSVLKYFYVFTICKSGKSGILILVFFKINE